MGNLAVFEEGEHAGEESASLRALRPDERVDVAGQPNRMFVFDAKTSNGGSVLTLQNHLQAKRHLHALNSFHLQNDAVLCLKVEKYRNNVGYIVFRFGFE